MPEFLRIRLQQNISIRRRLFRDLCGQFRATVGWTEQVACDKTEDRMFRFRPFVYNASESVVPTSEKAVVMSLANSSITISGWERVAMAIERIRQRLHRTAAALDAAQVPYAVIGGNAVAEWVGRVDEGAVRFTRDVDILLDRCDLPPAIAAMEAVGFVYQSIHGVEMFLDGPDSRSSEAVHIVFAGEKVKADDLQVNPSVQASEHTGSFVVLSLKELVQMKLISFRRKDQTHLEDMISVGLIDRTWIERYQPNLGHRLAEIFDSLEN